MHRIDGAGFAPGNLFTEGNPATALPATAVTADWLNDLQEELMSILTAAAVAPVKGNRVQLLAALRSAGVFSTPPQFDASTKAATMEALQRALGNKRSWIGINANTVLGATAVGALVGYLGGATYTVTLPAASGLVGGSTVSFYNNTTVDQIVAASGADTIAFGSPSHGGVVGSSFTIPAGATATFSVVSASSWHVADGTATLSGIASMYALKGASGYQRLPSGLIIQWGTAGSIAAGGSLVVTRPIAFPSTHLMTLCGNSFSAGASSGSSAVGVSYGATPLTTFTVYELGTVGQPNVPWLSIGY